MLGILLVPALLIGLVTVQTLAILALSIMLSPAIVSTALFVGYVIPLFQ